MAKAAAPIPQARPEPVQAGKHLGRGGGARHRFPVTPPGDAGPHGAGAVPAALNGSLEMWGGVECSVVRIGDHWRDQLHETGHHHRPEDLDLIAGLGVRTLRYPLLWERLAPDQAGADGWRWHDQRLSQLRALGIDVIAGLLHHGSGPPGTDLLDPAFPEAFAGHALRAAARHPFITAWTPVNEPLTTARFSCLYGFWYPHLQNEEAFLRAVANQCRAVLLAMRHIRRVTPGARLVQTEDIGKAFSTPRLAYQAEHENQRRWLSLDLLHGRVDHAHPWRSRMEGAGVPAEHLDAFLSGDAVPDLIGVNFYVTSERFLDHRLQLYPALVPSSNGRHAFVDTEAVRSAVPDGATGWGARLREVWERYRRPMAITEAHLGSADEAEQVRWLLEAWQAALALRAEGADVRAVTAWSLFGAVDWDSMLRKVQGHYEAGAWSADQHPPRRTLVAEAVSALARHGTFAHPAVHGAGWWKRAGRLHAAAGA